MPATSAQLYMPWSEKSNELETLHHRATKVLKLESTAFLIGLVGALPR